MNSIFSLTAFDDGAGWMLTDKERGLIREPFVAGADTLIDLATANIPNARDGVVILFSENPFPGYQFTLVWLKAEHNGNWYHCGEFDFAGWFCPALLAYFAVPPKVFYAQVKS